MSDTQEASSFMLYRYEPSLVAAAMFSALFFVVTLLHLYQLLRTRTWVFIPFVIGGFFEALGYIGRAMNATEVSPNWTLGPYIMQSILLLVAPALFAASIYMVLGRIILVTDGERHSVIRIKWLAKIFVSGDIISFMTQSGGGGLMAMEGMFETGEHIVVAGLIIQIVIFSFFVAIAGIFHRRQNREPSEKLKNVPSIPWEKHIHILYGTSAIILIRSLFRLVEFAMGNDGYLLRNEVWLYIFDAALMLAVMVWFAVVHPSEIYALLKGGRTKAVKHGFKVYEMNDLQQSRWPYRETYSSD